MFAPAVPFTQSTPLLRSIRSPKRMLIGLFLVLAGLASTQAGGNALTNVAIAVALAAGIDLAFATVRGEKLAFPDGAILTGIIVAFLLSPLSRLRRCCWP